MKLKGRIINGGSADGEAFVLDIPFSLIGEFDPKTGKYGVQGHPLFGESMAGKILVCPTGKGGTIAPFIAYEAWKNGTAPVAILCEKADPILCESALTINIPVLDKFDASPVKNIKTGQRVSIRDDEVIVK
jgi:predicted aconitase with swiveling domain